MDLAQFQALEARITRMEDIEAIKQLKALYCEICDDSHNPERIVQIFTEDGTWEGKGIGTARGHAQIRALFEGFRDMMTFTEHMTMNPRIAVDGDRATGTWYFFGPFTFRPTKERPSAQAKWQAARYEEQYRKVDGEWKIHHLKVSGPGMSVDYAAGWAEQRYQ